MVETTVGEAFPIGSMRMSDPNSSFDTVFGDTVFGREAGNSVMNLIAAVCNAWTSTLSVLRGIAEQTAASASEPGQEPAADPLTTSIDTSAAFARLVSEIVARRTEFEAGHAAGRASGSDDFHRGGELSSLVMQIWIICATSALRYWSGLAGVYTRHQPALIRSAARAMPRVSTPEAEDRLLADQLRAYLREIGDVAEQEARRLQRELERIGEAAARSFDRPEAAKSFRRRWKAKD
jgi:hypothetical protein